MAETDPEPLDGEPLGDAADAARKDEQAGDPQSDLERLQTEIGEAKDMALRARAELENFRKRAQRELQEERRYANIHLMRDLLPVLDNVDRAIKAAEKSGMSNEAASLLAGFRIVEKQLNSLLDQYHCKQIDTDGAQFDPNLHEAILQQPSPDHPDGAILTVTEIGYLLHDRVVRPSKVIVTKKPQE